MTPESSPATIPNVFRRSYSFTCLLFILASVPFCRAQVQVTSTVIDKKTGAPITDVSAQEFHAEDDKSGRKIESVEFKTEPMDSMLLVDASLVGESVRPVVRYFIEQLQPKE